MKWQKSSHRYLQIPEVFCGYGHARCLNIVELSAFDRTERKQRRLETKLSVITSLVFPLLRCLTLRFRYFSWSKHYLFFTIYHPDALDPPTSPRNEYQSHCESSPPPPLIAQWRPYMTHLSFKQTNASLSTVWTRHRDRYAEIWNLEYFENGIRPVKSYTSSLE